MPLPLLPIDAILPAVHRALAHGCAVLAAPPGSGKTTIVPLALLEAPWLAGKKILILEPRRLAARAAAARMASLLGEKVGQTVGYQVRFDRQISATTRIEVLTEGILTRRLQHDADLSDTGLIIFDEFHERSLHADLALALCLDLCQLQEELRLLVMSATLDTAPLAALMGGVPIITGTGRSFEVRIEYLRQPATGRISAAAAQAVRRVLAEQCGDVLVFLPGSGEIQEVQQQLSTEPACRDLVIAPLYGDLAPADQDRALRPDPDGRRRVILATSIAETSLTIEGITCVVDSGWSRRPRFDPGNGLSRLVTVRVSQAAAGQRAGRAGRLGPGYCLRLWTGAEQHSLVPFHPPEILETDLAALALELAQWGVSDPQALPWLDPPRSGPWQQARQLLRTLDALDDRGQLTAAGKLLAALPLHPRLGHMLLRAGRIGQTSLACDLAALLAERDPLRRDGRPSSADLSLRLQLLELWRAQGDAAVNRQGGEPALCRRIDRAARQWRQLLPGSSGRRDHGAIGTLLVWAYPDRLARRRPGVSGRYLLASGREALLAPGDPLAASEFLVVPQLDAGHREGRIFLAEAVDPAQLLSDHPALFVTSETICWDEDAARVTAISRLSLGAIVMAERPIRTANPEAVRQALLDGIRRRGLDCLNWDREARQLQARIECLRRLQPHQNWPDLSDQQLALDLGWLEPYLQGLSKAEQLRQIDLALLFKAMLGWERQQQLEHDAPASFLVPSGSKIRIEYRLDEPPLLAVRIQELFGLDQTPAIAGGTVVLLLHLLSPARRPIQITSDLAGFWQRSYPEVKKELRGRYPKHSWPDDPARAEAIRGVRRKT